MSPPRTVAIAQVVHAVGRLLITSGVVVLLFVAYELWGTNLQTNQAQHQLDQQFDRALAQEATGDNPVVRSTTTTQPETTTPQTTPVSTAPTTPPPAEGDAVGQISIPSIGIQNFSLVQGVSVTQLKRGAGHYPETPLPGQAGNAAIAGHRTTYGAPFHNIDKVKPGDEVVVRTLQGTFHYKVVNTKVVAPSEVSVLDDFKDNRLTLTACHPKFSARQRIILTATLVGSPVPKLPGQDAAAKKIASQPSEQAARRSAIDDYVSAGVLRYPGAFYGLVLVGLWVAIRVGAWRLRDQRLRRLLPYAAGLPVCLGLLYLFFENFNYEAFVAMTHLSV